MLVGGHEFVKYEVIFAGHKESIASLTHDIECGGKLIYDMSLPGMALSCNYFTNE